MPEQPFPRVEDLTAEEQAAVLFRGLTHERERTRLVAVLALQAAPTRVQLIAMDDICRRIEESFEL